MRKPIAVSVCKLSYSLSPAISSQFTPKVYATAKDHKNQ